jgi:hypothetical protein
MGEMGFAYKILIGKSKGRKPFGISRRRWEFSVRMYLRKTGWEFWTEFNWLCTGTCNGLL